MTSKGSNQGVTPKTEREAHSPLGVSLPRTGAAQPGCSTVPASPSAWRPDMWDGGWPAWRSQAAELYLQLIHNTPSVYFQVGSGVLIHPRGHQVPSFIITTTTMAYHWLHGYQMSSIVVRSLKHPMCLYVQHTTLKKK